MSRPAVATGEVWLADLDSTVGSEIQTARPCVVVSPPEMHDYLRTVIVAPMTTGSQPAAFRIGLTFQGKTGLVLLDQIRTLDKVRLKRNHPGWQFHLPYSFPRWGKVGMGASPNPPATPINPLPLPCPPSARRGGPVGV